MMDDFDRLLDKTSLGTDGAQELIAAVPDRVVERTMEVARAERAKLDALIVERLTAGVHALATVPVGASGDAAAALELDTQLDSQLDDDLVATQELFADGAGDGDEARPMKRRRSRRHRRVELRDLAALAGDGDRTALNDLLTRVRAVAHRYVRSRLWTYPGGADMVDDVAQEVCVAVFGALGRYRDEGRSFEAFVYGIAARKVADAQRAFAAADAAASEQPDGGERSARADSVERDDEVQEIMALLDKLPEKLREVLRLRVIAGMSAEETGRAMGMTPGAVRSLQHRALNTLRGFAAHEEEVLVVDWEGRGVDGYYSS